MSRGIRALYVLLILLSVSIVSTAQEESEGEMKHNKLSLVMAHSHISQGVVDDGKKYKISPSFAVSYEYFFTEKWAVGLHVDLILEDFEVEKSGSENEIIERNKPIAPALMVTYKPTEHSAFLIGGGMEFTGEDSYALTRISYEWSTPINEKWEFAIPFSYDIRWEAYNVWMLGFGIAYEF